MLFKISPITLMECKRRLTALVHVKNEFHVARYMYFHLIYTHIRIWMCKCVCIYYINDPFVHLPTLKKNFCSESACHVTRNGGQWRQIWR